LALALAACAAGPVRDEKLIERLHPSMSAAEVEAIAGQSYRKAANADGSVAWTYKYREANIAKLAHVILGRDGRVLRVETEWDPDVYSKKP
jgi:hypothetical protein